VRRILIAIVLCATACASTLALRGERVGKRLDVHARAAVDRGTARLTVELENHGDQPIGVDVDSIILQDQKGATFLGLGQLQSFALPGETARASQRVPHGATTVDPQATKSVSLDFEKLPTGATLTLVIPALYRLGIDGQVPMKAVEVPLQVDTSRASESPDAGFFDPFVE
jgi:hypothetical protein